MKKNIKTFLIALVINAVAITILSLFHKVDALSIYTGMIIIIIFDFLIKTNES